MAFKDILKIQGLFQLDNLVLTLLYLFFRVFTCNKSNQMSITN